MTGRHVGALQASDATVSAFSLNLGQDNGIDSVRYGDIVSVNDPNSAWPHRYLERRRAANSLLDRSVSTLCRFSIAADRQLL